MAKVENWTQRYFLERFVFEIGESISSDINERADKGLYKDLAEVVLTDGQPLNLDDPALLALIKFLDVTGFRTVENLQEICDGLRDNFQNEPTALRLVSGNPEMIDAIFALKDTGGWGELDRISLHLIGKSLTDLVDAIQPTLRFNPDDPGLGGGTCYMIGHDSQNAPYPKVAFGSSPEYVLGFLQDAAHMAGDAFKKDDRPRTYLSFRRNRTNIFSIPLLPAKISVYAPHAGGGAMDYLDYSSPQIQWADVVWNEHDLATMKKLAQVAPENVRHLIKGAYLQDDLGM